jgi:hypothetical protein
MVNITASTKPKANSKNPYNKNLVLKREKEKYWAGSSLPIQVEKQKKQSIEFFVRSLQPYLQDNLPELPCLYTLSHKYIPYQLNRLINFCLV